GRANPAPLGKAGRGVGAGIPLPGHAGRSRAEQEDAVARDRGRQRGGGRGGGEEKGPGGGAAAPRLERLPAGVTDEIDLIEVIHAGAAERAVAGGEACGLDDVRLEAEAGGETKNRARVLRNVGLKQRNAHGPSLRARSEPRSRAKRKTDKRFVRLLIVATQTRTCPLALAWQGCQ